MSPSASTAHHTLKVSETHCASDQDSDLPPFVIFLPQCGWHRGVTDEQVIVSK